MPPKVKIWFFRWFIFEAVIVIITLTRFVLYPYKSGYVFAIIGYCVVLASMAAFCVTFIIFRKRYKIKE